MLLRVSDPDKSAFQLRKGEEGISVFETDAVTPSLTEDEILAAFRAGSHAVQITAEQVAAKGLHLEQILGASFLPQRLREAHMEIRPSPNMTRTQFKQALKELE